MSRTINRDQLWSMSTEQVVERLKGKTVKVFMKDGSIQLATIKNVSVAPGNPNLPCDFLKSDGHWILLENIESIEILAE